MLALLSSTTVNSCIIRHLCSCPAQFLHPASIQHLSDTSSSTWFLYLEVVGNTSTIHHYPELSTSAGWMDPALVLDPKLFDDHYPAFVKHLSGIGAGLIQHHCQMVLDGCWMVPDHQHHTSLSSIHKHLSGMLTHWCQMVPDRCQIGAGWVPDQHHLALMLTSDTVHPAPLVLVLDTEPPSWNFQDLIFYYL